MHGLVNKGLRDLVIDWRGPSAWSLVQERAMVDEDYFIANQAYDDAVTYRLVAAAAEVLGVELTEVLQRFGEWWVLSTAKNHYGALMHAHGRSLREFLLNLPNLHTRVLAFFPDLRPPEFTSEEVSPGRFELHYRSERAGLAPFVLGLLQGLGKWFETPVEIRHDLKREQGADHDVFQIAWKDSKKP